MQQQQQYTGAGAGASRYISDKYRNVEYNNTVVYIANNKTEFLDILRRFPKAGIKIFRSATSNFDFDDFDDFDADLLAGLKYLDISGCNYLNNNMFKYMQQLEYLDAAYCEIKWSYFQSLINLKYLRISGDNNLNGDIFQYLPQLERLEMNYCDQTTIESKHFETMHNMQL